MVLIGLTGGVASGKSTVARRLVEHGAVHVEADALARRAVAAGTPGLRAVVAAFGARVLAANGTLDRAVLGAMVFADPALLAKLNAIVHPEVRRLACAAFEAAVADNPDAVVVYDVPLLVEAAVDHPFDCIVVTQAARSAQLERLALRGLDPVAAAARIDAQASDAQRQAVADVIIRTDTSLAATMSEVDGLWAQIRAGQIPGGAAS